MLILSLLRVHLVICYSIRLWNDVQGPDQVSNGSDFSLNNDPLIPEDFRATIQLLGGGRLSPIDAYTLITRAVATLGVTQYNAEMTVRDFRWPKNNPRVALRFDASGPEHRVEVRHQMWALSICASAMARGYGQAVLPFSCRFTTDPAIVPFGRFVILAVAAQSDLGSITTELTVQKSSINESYLSKTVSPPVTTFAKLNTSLVGSDSNDDLDIRIGHFKEPISDKISLFFAAIQTILEYAAWNFARKPIGLRTRVDFKRIVTEITVDHSVPNPRGYRENWHDFIRLIGGTITYLSSNNLFVECGFGIFLGEEVPIVRGSFKLRSGPNLITRNRLGQQQG